MQPLATMPATTRDTFYHGRVRVIQPEKGYRFGMDAMILAASVEAEPHQHVLELGCGVGAAMLGAAFRLPNVSFTGIEREPVYAQCARDNVQENSFDARMRVIEGDVTDKALFKQLGSFDQVILNPPYFEAHNSNAMMTALRRVARHESGEGLEAWITAANRFLKPKGRMTIIHSADRISDILVSMQRFTGGLRVFPLWSYDGVAAKRVLVQGTKGSKAPLQLMAGLVLHQHQDSSYTKDADAVINQGRCLWST